MTKEVLMMPVHLVQKDLESEKAVELPKRHLMATVSVLGLPLVGVSDVGANVDTSGPGWLVSTD